MGSFSRAPRQRRGKPIRARSLNAIASELDAHARIRQPWSVPQRSVGGINLLGSEPGEVGLTLARSPTSSLAAGASGVFTLYTDGSGTTIATETRSAVNPSGSAIPANSKCWITYDRGVWAVAGWFC